jgi:hypothetical protein
VSELLAALAAAQAEMSNAPYNQTNPAYKSKYADLASIRDATVPHLAKHGLSIHQVMSTNGQGLVLITRLGHASGQWIVSEYPIPSSDRPHVMGSAITYARRYSWAAICGVAAEEDEDGNAAQEGAKNGTPANPFFPKRKSSAQAKRDGDWATLEQALKDCQSAREVERLREEWVRDVYPSWKDDWRDSATEAFDKRLADFSQPGSLKQTLKDSIEYQEPVTAAERFLQGAADEQDAKFHECWEWLENAATLTELVMRADNAGFREGLKMLTKDQVSQLRALKAARMEKLGETPGK